MNVGNAASWFIALLVLVYFTFVFVYDLKYRSILRISSLIGLLLGLSVGWLHQGLVNTLLGGMAGLFTLLCVYFLGIFFGRFIGKFRESGDFQRDLPFGFGDVLFGGVIGLMAGWPDILRSLLISLIAAGLFSALYLAALLIRRRYHLGVAIPITPFLIFGTVWVLFF